MQEAPSDCSTAVVWSCWSFYLDFVCVCRAEGATEHVLGEPSSPQAPPSCLPTHPWVPRHLPWHPAQHPLSTLSWDLGLGVGTWGPGKVRRTQSGVGA